MNNRPIPEVIAEALATIDALQHRLAQLEEATGLFVPDADLDKPRVGNPSVKFDPKQWRGRPHKGKRFSESEPAFLDVYASALQWLADHPKPDKDPKFAAYDRKDAARGRSWARRLRSGWRPPESTVGEFPGDAAGASAPSFESPPIADAPGFDAPSFSAPKSDDDDFPF